MKRIKIYTDGACSGNPGKGGWGAVLIYKGIEKEISGVCEKTTNNQMELTAVLEALKVLKEKCDISIYSDSAYVVNAFKNDWISGWQQNGWKNSSHQPVANKELWIELLTEVSKHKVNFNKVAGHSGDKYNEICDKLATKELKKSTSL